jgi:hypothetical protein
VELSHQLEGSDPLDILAHCLCSWKRSDHAIGDHDRSDGVHIVHRDDGTADNAIQDMARDHDPSSAASAACIAAISSFVGRMWIKSREAA